MWCIIINIYHEHSNLQRNEDNFSVFLFGLEKWLLIILVEAWHFFKKLSNFNRCKMFGHVQVFT